MLLCIDIRWSCLLYTSYELIKEDGPDHQKTFTVEARLGEKVIGTGTGRSKKSAEQTAAYEAMKHKDGILR